jgi:hypothetical protein
VRWRFVRWPAGSSKTYGPTSPTARTRSAGHPARARRKCATAAACKEIGRSRPTCGLTGSASTAPRICRRDLSEGAVPYWGCRTPRSKTVPAVRDRRQPIATGEAWATASPLRSFAVTRRLGWICRRPWALPACHPDVHRCLRDVDSTGGVGVSAVGTRRRCGECRARSRHASSHRFRTARASPGRVGHCRCR